MGQEAEIWPEQSQRRVLGLTANDANLNTVELVARALSSDTRLAILRFLGEHTCSLSEIATALDLPTSTANLHINILEKSGLIKTDLQPATRGVQRVCARMYDDILFSLPLERILQDGVTQVSMPIGAYVAASVVPTCGLLSSSGYIGVLDDPVSFFEPERMYAQLLWFHHGYIEYRFPNRLPANAWLESLELSFEACSEAPLHHPDWPSDIFVAINGVELGVWTSPADFGGQRGVLTPLWWDTYNSQYGLLKTWKVTSQGSFVDEKRVSKVALQDLCLNGSPYVNVYIGIKGDAQHVGGINLFGGKFGNFPQDILLTQYFHRDR